jgi:hypothetical protein
MSSDEGVLVTVVLSTLCSGWAQTAGFDVRIEGGETQLWPHDRDRGRCRIRERGNGRVDLLDVDPDGVEEMVLFTADQEVMEVFLIAMLGDEVREDLDLEYLDLPTEVDYLAPGYELTKTPRGDRLLTRIGVGPVAATSDDAAGLGRLVTLSRFLALGSERLKRAFLHPEGYPLLVDGKYENATA